MKTFSRVTRSFDIFFDLCLNKRLSKQLRRRWFDTPSHPLWRHCNVKKKHSTRISYGLYYRFHSPFSHHNPCVCTLIYHISANKIVSVHRWSVCMSTVGLCPLIAVRAGPIRLQENSEMWRLVPLNVPHCIWVFFWIPFIFLFCHFIHFLFWLNVFHLLFWIFGHYEIWILLIDFSFIGKCWTILYAHISYYLGVF